MIVFTICRDVDPDVLSSFPFGRTHLTAFVFAHEFDADRCAEEFNFANVTDGVNYVVVDWNNTTPFFADHYE